MAAAKDGSDSQLPKRTVSIKLEPMPRRATGSKGKRILLISNHFKVDTRNLSGNFYCYNVLIMHENGYPVDKKAVKRRIMDGINETYAAELAGKKLVYDGNKILYTLGPLPDNKMEFFMVIDNVSSERVENFGEDEEPECSSRKRLKHSFKSRTFKTEISFVTKIPVKAIADVLNWQKAEICGEVLVVLNTILKQYVARKGCLLVGQRFFENEPKNFTNLGGGIYGCRGFYSKFQSTQKGLSLNFGVSNITIIQPGPVVDFLLANQHVKECHQIDWNKAKRTLKNLKIKVNTTNREYRITGLSEKPCKKEMFLIDSKSGDPDCGKQITVYDYFIQYHHIKADKSAELPCINVGNSNRPIYFPLEICSLLSLQRYNKKLSSQQKRSMIEKSSLRPHEMIKVLKNELKCSNYNSDPIIRSCGMSINYHVAEVEGRVLSAPRLRVGDGKDCNPQNGRWSYSNKKIFEPARIKHWAVANFSGFKIRNLCEDLRKVGEMRGMAIDSPKIIFEENQNSQKAPSFVRVEKMFEQIHSKFPKDSPPYFILCLFPRRKNPGFYGLWKRRTLEAGIFNQCLCLDAKISEHCLEHILFKINAKLGGLNSLLIIEHIPLVSKVPTMIFGMSLSYGPNHQSNVPSIASVVASRHWPLVSRYKASVRIQKPGSTVIDFKASEQEDIGIVRELLLDFYATSAKRKPAHIIIFRDGVGESQFNQVLNMELVQFIEACRCLDESWSPKVTVIASSRKHHTRFFQPRSPENVPPGLVIDNTVCHPHNYDFYMCPHSTRLGTTRPTHYHVLLDEICFPVDELQELIHALSYVYQRCSSAISEVAPVRYARLVAALMSELMASDKMPNSSTYGSSTSSASPHFMELPKLHENVRNSMFFC